MKIRMAGITMAMLMFSACDKVVLSENWYETGEEMEEVESGALVVCNVNALGLGADEQQEVGTRGLSADGYELTEIWVFDCFENGCKLVAKQTSEEENFGVVRFRLDYGQHRLAFVASRGQDADYSEQTCHIVWGKVKDTFWNFQDVVVDGSTPKSLNVALDRVVGKLKVDFSDTVPAELKKVTMCVESWMFGIDVRTGEGVGSLTTAAATDGDMEIEVPTAYVGTKKLSLSLWGFSRQNGISTDVNIAWSNGSTVIAERTCEGVPLWKNKVTRISGEMLKKEMEGTLNVNGLWDEQYEYEWQ